MIVRPLVAADLQSVLAIQQASPEAAQWSVADFGSLLCPSQSDVLHPEEHGSPPSDELFAFVADLHPGIVGFVVARRAGDEVEILNLAVAPAARRTGVASRLIAHALEAARNAGAPRAFLEVRESNRAARAFYLRHGFSITGRRREYYSSPREDALVLSRARA